MISFKDYLKEMSSQEEFTNVIKNVPKHKHDDFKKTYAGLRKKGVSGRSAMMQAYSLHRESVELEELSDIAKSNYKEKATPDIIKKLLKGDKHRAVKRAKAVSKLDKEIKENMGGWNHKGAIVTGNMKPVDPNWQSPEEKQKAQMLAHIKARKELAMKRQAEMDADIAKNPVTPEEQKRAEKLLAGAIKTGKFMKDKMGA